MILNLFYAQIKSWKPFPRKTGSQEELCANVKPKKEKKNQNKDNQMIMMNKDSSVKAYCWDVFSREGAEPHRKRIHK
jgi:hypothetical protein